MQLLGNKIEQLSEKLAEESQLNNKTQKIKVSKLILIGELVYIMIELPLKIVRCLEQLLHGCRALLELLETTLNSLKLIRRT